jgi:hypothetical protein
LEDNKGYYESERLLFQPLYTDDRLHPKTIVVGVRDEKRNALAIVKDWLRQEKVIEATLGGMNIVLIYNEALDYHEARIKATPIPSATGGATGQAPIPSATGGATGQAPIPSATGGATGQAGERLNSFDAFWFAWYAFYPDTQLLQ